MPQSLRTAHRHHPAQLLHRHQYKASMRRAPLCLVPTAPSAMYLCILLPHSQHDPSTVVLQEMNGAVDEAEVRRAAQLFSDLSRVVSAKQLGPMLRTQVLRNPGIRERVLGLIWSQLDGLQFRTLCTPELLHCGSRPRWRAGSWLTAWPVSARQAMRSAYGDAPDAGSSGVRLLLDTNVVMLKEDPYAAMVSDR